MDASGFMPHGYCLLWKPSLVALHVLSDGGIGLAYLSIPLTLRYFVAKRRDMPFSWIFVMFAAFIGLCGFTHIMSIITLWQPWYWLDGTLKALTAGVSILTAITLVPLIPRALSMRSPGELSALNDRLEHLLREKDDLLEAYRRQTYVATALQRAMLPQELPVVEGLRIDASYAPAGADVEVGGDWYDVFTLPDGRIALGVGDVAGHGIRSATVMGTLRQVIRASAREDASPSTVLARANRWLFNEPDHAIVSAFFAVFEPATGRVTFARAGHPAPLAVREDGRIDALEVDGVMLGIDRRAHYPEGEMQLAVGCGLVLYTDGLIESGRDVLDGLRRLETVVAESQAMAGSNIAETIRERMLEGSEPFDDSAVLFVGVTDLSPVAVADYRSWSFDARDEVAAHRVRRALLWYLGEYASVQADLSAAELIVGELIGNVARHTPGAAHVSVHWSGTEAELAVRDFGPPFELRSLPDDMLSEGGRGIFLASRLGSGFNVERLDNGNLVCVKLPVLRD